MLGCAAEKASLLLIEKFGNAIQDPAKRQKYERLSENDLLPG
jgi:hypothetical protein